MATRTEQAQQGNIVPAILRDGRMLQGIAQLIFVVIVVIVMNDLLTRINTALESTNQSPNFEFPAESRWFRHSGLRQLFLERPLHRRISSRFHQYLAGWSLLGLVSTTIIGVMVGIFLLSKNFLVRTISRSYVEVLRNTPILLQIFAWFYIAIFALPPQQQSIAFPQEGIRSLPLMQYALSFRRNPDHLAVRRDTSAARLAERCATGWSRHSGAGQSARYRAGGIGHADRIPSRNLY